MQYLRNISRFITAIVFIFSGFVKGVDPLGTAYRFEDYFIAYGTEWAIGLSLFMSFALCTLEFIIGIALLFNLRMKLTAWLLLLIMVFFTILTLFDAFYEPVSDCGCFGDAIKLTNWETFYKNVVLLFFALIVFRQRHRFKSAFGQSMQASLAVIFIIGFVWFSIYNYRHLPVIDFRVWKVGNQMTPDPEQEMEIYLQYQNKQTGEMREYLSPNYPWNDSAWMADWEFVSQRVVSHGEVLDHGLYVEDEQGYDNTEYVLGHPDYLFVAIVNDFHKAVPTGLSSLSTLEQDLSKVGIPMVFLTGTLAEEVNVFQEKYNFSSEVFYADVVTLKTMIRSNPGLMLFKAGKVMGKWHYRNIPNGVKMDVWLNELLLEQMD